MAAIETIPKDAPDWKNQFKEKLGGMIAELRSETLVSEEDAWDFSEKKTLSELVSDGLLRLRPILQEDCNFYSSVRKQHATMPHIWEDEDFNRTQFTVEAMSQEVFLCIIEESETGSPLGFIGIKDTRIEPWEVAIELTQKSCSCGYGPRAIHLFLSEISRITGKQEFQFIVEVDNLPCQRCMEKLNARLTGLRANRLFRTEEERRIFENKNQNHINAHIIELSEQLSVEPCMLLSHFLDYRLEI